MGEHPPQKGEGDADHPVVVAVHSVDEGAAQSVDREGPGHVQGFARGDVGVDLLPAQLADVDDGVRDGSERGAAARMDEAVAGVQDPGPARHAGEPLAGHTRIVRLADGLPIELEHRIAAQDERLPRGEAIGVLAVAGGLDARGRPGGLRGCRPVGARRLRADPAGHRTRLRRRQGQDPLGRPAPDRLQDGVLVDPGDLDDGIRPGRPQGRQPGRGGARQDEPQLRQAHASASRRTSSPTDPSDRARMCHSFRSKSRPEATAAARARSRSSPQMRCPTL